MMFHTNNGYKGTKNNSLQAGSPLAVIVVHKQTISTKRYFYNNNNAHKSKGGSAVKSYQTLSHSISSHRVFRGYSIDIKVRPGSLREALDI